MEKIKTMKFKLNKSKGLIFLILLLTARISWAQQDPMFTQYNFNMQTVNPAYAGTWESMGFLVLGRYQWAGMPGAPTTYTFSMQTPTRNKKVGLGLNVINDQIGKEQRLSLFGDYSYRLKMSENTYLRLGLKFGVTNYNNILSQYAQNDEDGRDPISDGEIDVKYMPNFGVGAFLYSERYYVGFSIPKLIRNEFKNNFTNLSTESELQHFFLTAGYVANLSENLKFKPSILTKAIYGAPVELDLSANFLLKDKIWLGAMYRINDSYGFIAQWIFDKKLRLGYAIDFTTTPLQSFHNGSHELMISYEIGLKRKWSTPRMF
ncbi:MAG: type IX secretion system membrane protein PorP/SprF [Prolixibacteraceae bacterium]|nr:type IX secretion system membrane protein PorP/SprF [Prolixibacteraceae bacterium]